MDKGSGENLACPADVESSLRDRIAAVLASVEVVLDGDTLNDTSTWLLADAVIAALGLRYQLAPEGGPWTGHHRYLTDWKWEPTNE